VAYSGGYQGGYADTLVPPGPPVVEPGGGGYQYLTRPASRRKGRARIRLTVTVLTWGAEARHSTRHTIAAAALTEGTGTARATTHIGGELRLRHGTATTRTRADLGTHIGDPKEDDRLIALCLAALLEDTR
jgi:hypothetical protein